MKKGTISKLVAASVLACAASASQAALVDVWNYSVDMAWVTSATQFSSSTNPNSDPFRSSTVLSWGYKNGLGGYEAPIGSDARFNRSSLVITHPNGTGAISSNDSVEMVNMFRHTNNAIDGSFAALTETTLRVSVDLTPQGSSVPVETLTKDFKIFFWETPNVGGTCGWGNCDNDLFAFVVMPEIFDVFTYGGYSYTFNYFQTSGPNAITQFSADVCGQISGGKLTTSCYGFQTAESARTSLQFGFSITAVPEPETYAMMLAGLAMVGTVVRRRKALRK
ncbi:MAG: THxN family PEP-CTERM protein [Azoarcus sp.]|jgi:hypothetical protein|nr:THxN family PEP-CTERM protein [Azoarcus sp.]